MNKRLQAAWHNLIEYGVTTEFNLRMFRTLKASSACSQKILSTNISAYITNVNLSQYKLDINFDQQKWHEDR
jgi:hypothetical protein